MGCNCRDMKGFDLTMFKAKSFENKTGKQAAIFIKGETVSFTDLSNIGKVEGICCYFTTDNVEHEIVKEIEVVEAKEIKPKRKRSKKKPISKEDVKKAFNIE